MLLLRNNSQAVNLHLHWVSLVLCFQEMLYCWYSDRYAVIPPSTLRKTFLSKELSLYEMLNCFPLCQIFWVESKHVLNWFNQLTLRHLSLRAHKRWLHSDSPYISYSILPTHMLFMVTVTHISKITSQQHVSSSNQSLVFTCWALSCARLFPDSDLSST